MSKALCDDMSYRRHTSRSGPSPSPSPSPGAGVVPSPGAGGSGTAPDLRPLAEVVPKSAGGFELQPSDFILQVSRKSFMGRMSECWPRWDDIPGHIMNAIWADLMAAVRVDEQEMDVFANHWHKKMRKNYRDTLSKAKSAGKRPTWMSEAVWSDFVKFWETPEVKELAARNRANRLKNPSLHRGGSKSFQQHRAEMAAKNNGEPTMAQLFTATHAVEQTDEDGNISYVWSDAKAQSVMASYEAERARVAQASGQEQLTVEECNHIWDTIIDPPTRNRRYSYGNMEAMTAQAAYRKSQAEAEIAQLKQQIAEINDWRKSATFTQQLDEHIAAFLNEHGIMPGEDDSGDDEQ